VRTRFCLREQLRVCVSTGERTRRSPRQQALGLYPRTNSRVPHISLVFREMWDTTGLSLKPAKVSTTPYGCPMFAPAYVGRKRWAKPTKAFRTELYASFLSAGTKRNGGFSSPGTHTPSLAPACPARSRNFFRALLSSRGADWWNSLPRRHWQTRI
jgi:hypothetical protein